MNLTACTFGNPVEQKIICTKSKDKWCAGRNIYDTIIIMTHVLIDKSYDSAKYY